MPLNMTSNLLSSIRRKLLTCIITFAILCLAGLQSAQAQTCFFAIDNVNFGTINTSTGAPFDTTSRFRLLCFGGFAGQTIRVCPNLGSATGGVVAGGHPRLMQSGANQLGYNLYTDPARTNVWGSVFWGQPPGPPNLTFTFGGGVLFAQRLIYARVPGGQTGAAAGTYSSAFSGGHVSINYADASAGNCAAIGTTNTTVVSFNVTATNTPTCALSTTDLDFGTHGSLSSNIDSTNTLTVNCTNGTAYTISLNGGNAGAIDPTQRRMSAGANDVIYGLYRNAARTQPWGSTIGTNTVAGTGTGNPQAVTVYGRVAPQATPPAGTYTDLIVVTVTY